MPKIIENLPSRFVEEARRQTLESGISSMTVRSVANACGVGVGTLYNYFPSKDALTAAFMLEDWERCMAAIREPGAQPDSPPLLLRRMYDGLRSFAAEHEALFRDVRSTEGLPAAFPRYHALLRTQLSEPLLPFCGDGFTAEFVAEAMLTWTMAGRSFGEIFRLIRKLL